MRAVDGLRLAAGGLVERKTRTLLTLLGIVIGAGMIVALVSMTQGASAAMREELSSLGPTTLVVFANGDHTFTDADVQRVLRTEGVEAAYPAISGPATASRAGVSTQATILGVDPAALDRLLSGVSLAEGKWITLGDGTSVDLGDAVAHPSDARGRDLAGVRDVVRISVRVGADGPIGPITTERSTQYRVAGVADEFGTSPFLNVDGMVLMSPRAAKALLDAEGYNRILVLAESPASVASVQKALEEQFTRGDAEQASVLSGTAIAEAVQSAFAVMGAILGGVAAVSLIVAGVGIANTMLVSVLERVTEIGVMKALGFRAREILGIFLLEAGLTGAVGGALGALVGVGVSYGILGLLNGQGGAVARPEDGGPLGGAEFELHIEPVFTPEMLGLVLLFAVGVSVLAGLLPSRRAARLDPVVALKRL